jgi:type I restriction enzyme S subunit
MKAGWRESTLAEVCQFVNRGVSPKYVESGGIAVLNQKCIRDHEVSFQLCRRHDIAAKAVLADRLVRLGDVLVNSTGTGTLGRVAQMRLYVPEPTTVDSHVTIVRAADGIFVPAFFGYALIAIEHEIQGGGEGCGGQTELSRAKLANGFRICFPIEHAEQKRIVAILDQAFEAIATAQNNADRAAADVIELFDSALRSSFETRSETWRTEPLQTLVDKDCSLSYGIVQPGELVENGLPIVRPTDLTRKEVSVSGLKRIAPSLAQSYQRTKLRGNDLLLCVRGSTGVVSVACKELKDANVTRGIVPINFDPAIISQTYGYYVLKSPQVQEQVRAKTYGAALMQINISDVRKLSVPFPNLLEQGRIVEKLDALHLESERLAVVYRKKQQAVRALSKSLLDQAFSGQLV